MSEKSILRPSDVQEITGFSRNHVYKLFRRSDFPAKRHERSWFVARTAFEKWLERRDMDEWS